MMEMNAIAGLGLILLAGTCSGTFSVPFNRNKGWNWENNWFIWSLIALVFVPWIVALQTIPHLSAVYRETAGSTTLVALFGFIWGIGAIMFGKGIHYLGLSLSLPIMQGLINSVGTLLPIILRDPNELATTAGIKILIGVCIIITGVILFSLAGKQKEGNQAEQNPQTPTRFKTGLLICVLAGLLGPMVNFAFVYGVPLQEKAIEYGADPLYATNTIWSIALSAGFIINTAECIRLFRQNRSWQRYRQAPVSGLMFASLTGIIWYLSIMFYGMGDNMLGKMGASIGWATMQSIAILTGNIAGILSGEWRSASHKALTLMIAGLITLITGVIVIAC